MKTITLAQLIELGACEDQLEKFERMYGDSVEVTPALCESVASEFRFNWVAKHLLTPPARAEYERIRAAALVEERATAPRAWAEFERATAAAWPKYDRARAAALATYERATAPRAWAEFERARAPALAELMRIRVSALAEYERILARTFAELYNEVTP